jgi:hypothetical protein
MAENFRPLSKASNLGIEIGGPTPPDMDDEPLVHDLMTAPLIGAGEQRKVIQASLMRTAGMLSNVRLEGKGHHPQ